MASDLLGPGVSHGVLEAAQADPVAVEAVVRAVDGEDGGAGVGLGHASVPLEDDDFGPDLVVDLFPLHEHLLNVVLRGGEEKGGLSHDVLKENANQEGYTYIR